jgi:beta propeller repeat protein
MQEDRRKDGPGQSRFEFCRPHTDFFPGNRPCDNYPVNGIRKHTGIFLLGLFWFTALFSLHASALAGHEILIHSPNITADESSPDHYEYSGFFALDGSNLVWMNTWAERKIEEKRVLNRIYLMNLTDNSTVMISGTPGIHQESEFRPPVAVSGRYIVWSEFGRDDLFLYDATSGRETALTSDGSAPDQQWQNAFPDIDGDRVVWAKRKPYLSSNDQDIVFMNLTTGTRQNISTAAADQTDPSISGSRIVWTDKRNEPGGGDIYLYDLGTGITQPICTESGLQQKPKISGTSIVWMDYRNGKPAVYLYNISSGTTIRISRDLFVTDAPLLSGDLVVWQEYSDFDLRDERAGTIVVYNTISGVREILPVKTTHPQLLAVGQNRIVYADPDTRTLNEGFVHLFVMDVPVSAPVSLTDVTSPPGPAQEKTVTDPVSGKTENHAATAFPGAVPFSIGVGILLCRIMNGRSKK